MHNFKKLDVWKKAVNLATHVFEVTNRFPKSELYGITSQIRRSSVSISSNIAEGAGRGSVNEFQQFLKIAMGSSCELETQLIISRNLEYLNDQDFVKLNKDLMEIQKMIYSLDKKLDD